MVLNPCGVCGRSMDVHKQYQLPDVCGDCEYFVELELQSQGDGLDLEQWWLVRMFGDQYKASGAKLPGSWVFLLEKAAWMTEGTECPDFEAQIDNLSSDERWAIVDQINASATGRHTMTTTTKQ